MRTPVLLYALAVVVRAVLMVMFPDPGYPDSSYYVDVARSLAAGHGLTVDFVWIFAEVGGRIPADPVLPIASNAHWLPLASFIQAPFVSLFGPTAVASALPMVLVGSLAAPLTWSIARDVGASRTVQLGAGVLAAMPALGLGFMPQPENFAIFEPLIAATLWLAARGLRGDGRAYALSGLLVGLASIARNDAFLLAGAIGLVWVIDRVRAWRAGRPAQLSVAAAIGCAGLFFVIAGPWWLRQLAVFGSISPTASTGNALWLTDYRQWNSITADVSLGAFLDQGLGGIVASRMVGLIGSIANFAVVVCGVVLVPFVVIGAWRRRHSDDFLPWFLYLGILVAGATLLFPLHVPGGAFIHSAIGLAPQAYILALEGVALAVGWLARRRPSWDARTAVPLFSWVVVGLVVIGGLLYAPVVQAGWDKVRAPRRALAAELQSRGIAPDDRILSIDAAGLKYWTGHPGVVTPNDSLDTIESVADAYDIRWLVLERGGTVDALKPVIVDDQRPPWIGSAAFTVPAPDGGVPLLALYPVCAGADRTACAP